MKSSTIPSHDPAELGELERDVLLIVWRHGFVTADKGASCKIIETRGI